MNAELEKWLPSHAFFASGMDYSNPDNPDSFDADVVRLTDLIALFDGNVLVDANRDAKSEECQCCGYAGHDLPRYRELLQSAAIPDGKVLVPVDKITTVARDVDYSPHTSRHTPFLRISFEYDDYDSRDELAAMLAASQEQKQC